MATATDEEFREWAQSVRTSLRRTAFLLCGDWATADDLVQDALVKVYLRWRKIRTNPTAYARKAVSSCFIDSTRRPWRRETATEVMPETSLNGPDTTTRDTLLAALRRSGLPNLWIPSRDAFVRVAGIPLLGTGKTDLRALRDTVLCTLRLCA